MLTVGGLSGPKSFTWSPCRETSYLGGSGYNSYPHVSVDAQSSDRSEQDKLGTGPLADGAWTDATNSVYLRDSTVLKLYATVGAGILIVWVPA